MALERRLQNVETIKKRYQETTDTDISAGYVLKLDQTDLNGNRYKLQWFLPHHYVINPHKPENVRRVCNAAAKYQSVSLNNKPLSGPDLLQCLIGINFRSREHQIALSADIEAMFLQIALPSDDSRCLLFSWPEDSKHNMEFYEYKQHVSGAKNLPNLQITLSTKLRMIMQSTTKFSSDRFKEPSIWTTVLKQSYPFKKLIKLTRKSEKFFIKGVSN